MALITNASKAYATLLLIIQFAEIFSSVVVKPPVVNVSKSTNENGQFTARALGTNCDSSYSTMCLKLDIISFMEKLSDTGTFGLIPGLSLVKDGNSDKVTTQDKVAELARSFPNDPEKRLDSFLLYKIGSFLGSHSLKFKLLDGATKESLEMATNGEMEDGRSARYGSSGGGGGGGGGGGKRKGNKGGGMGGMMAAAMMMKGTLASMALGGLALLAGKALMTSLLALLLSGIIGLKSLMGGGGKSTTYEIVAKPVYSSSHSHSASHVDDYHGGGGDHGGYGGGGHGWSGRSLNIELPEHLKKNEP